MLQQTIPEADAAAAGGGWGAGSGGYECDGGEKVAKCRALDPRFTTVSSDQRRVIIGRMALSAVLEAIRACRKRMIGEIKVK